MSQQNITFGASPNDTNADTIRAAFAKVQTNFTELYRAKTLNGVTELNALSGLTQNQTTGRVNVAANIDVVRMYSTSMLLGIDARGIADGNSVSSSLLNRGANTIWIDINPSIKVNNIDKFGANSIQVSNALLTVSSSNQPNISTVGNLTTLNVIGNITGQASLNVVTINSNTLTSNTVTSTGNLNANAITVSSTLRVSTTTLTTTSATPAVILGIDTGVYRSVEFTVQGNSANSMQFTKIMATSSGTDVSYTEFGTAGDLLGTFTLAMSSNIMQLIVTPKTSSSTKFTVLSSALAV